jgi:hypothetical protein
MYKLAQSCALAELAKLAELAEPRLRCKRYSRTSVALRCFGNMAQTETSRLTKLSLRK